MRLNKLESMRGFAALYVVFHHLMPSNWLIFRFGQEAVILFFLLSGFVIHFSFMKNSDQPFGEYFTKRLLRIYLPLIFVLILGYLVRSGQAGHLVNPNLKELVLNLLMVQDVSSLKPNVIVNPYMGNSPLWSLSYEWWFYMLYFLIVKINKTYRNHTVYLIAIISAFLYLFSPTFLPRLLMYLSIWWTGVVLAENFIENQKIRIGNIFIPLLYLMVVVLIACVPVIQAFFSNELKSIGVHPVLEFRHLLFATVAVLIALLWQYFNWVGYDFIFKPFLPLASFSYAIYISHTYFIHASYLRFLDNKIIESLIYLGLMLLFSYALEIKIYPWCRKFLMVFQQKLEAIGTVQVINKK